MEEGLGIEWVVGVIGAAVLAVYWGWRAYYRLWYRPKQLEKILNSQGMRGRPYSLFKGDQAELLSIIREAMSKPIRFEDDFKKRVIPHVIRAIELYGKNSYTWVDRVPRVHISDPELVKEVLLKYTKFIKNHHDFDPITNLLYCGVGSMEGDPWAKRKKIISPAFHFEKLKTMLPAFFTSAEDLVKKWEKRIPEGASVELDVWPDIEAFTGDVISKTLYGSSYEEGRKIFQLMKELIYLTMDVVRSPYIPFRWLLPTKTNRRMRAIDKEVLGLVSGIVDNKLKAVKVGEQPSDDFLGLLLECNKDEIKKQGGDRSAGLNIYDIVGEAKLFYFAGSDTSSTLLVWTMILLGRYPEWQEKGREEVFQIFGDRNPDYDGISRLKVVTMILYEVLRLYSPAIELTKVAQEDMTLGPYFIPAGVQIMTAQLLLHHDPEIWGDDVMEFKPQRFAEGAQKATKNPSQGGYIPFSLGPRTCMGQQYALLEAKMCMAMVLRRFSWELSPSYVHAPYPSVTLVPQYGAHVIMRRL